MVSLHCHASQQFNIGISGGLPSNQVYYITTDRLGYLWIATPNGVVKYNGYSFKTFEISDGLPTNDVWSLYEDRQNRMWLLNMAYSIGYIKNDVYKKAIIPGPDIYIYPQIFSETDSGIAFISSKGYSNLNTLWLEHHDTIRHISLDDLNTPNSIHLINDHNELFCLSDHNVYKKSLFHLGNSYKLVAHSNQDYSTDSSIRTRYIVVSSMVVSFGTGNSLHVLNTKTSDQYYIPLSADKTENIHTAYFNKGKLYISTNKTIYIYNRNLVRLAKYDINTVVAKPGSEKILPGIYSDRFWGLCFGGMDHGLYLNYNSPALKKTWLPDNCKYTGQDQHKNQYWWNKIEKTLFIKSPSGTHTFKSLPFSNIEKVIPLNDNKALLLTAQGLFTYDINSYTIIPLYKEIKLFKQNEKNKPSETNGYSFANEGPVIDGVSLGENTGYLFVSKTKGLMHFFLNKDTLIQKQVIPGHLKGLCYDSVNAVTWVYGENTLFYYKQGWEPIQFTKELLDELGIKKIEKILVDNKFGNIIIQDYKKLFAFNLKNFTFRELLKNYQLTNFQTLLHENKLIVAGRFGVASVNIKGRGHFSAPVRYSNFKESNYTHIYDAIVSLDSILIVTENGNYSLPLAFAGSSADNYKLVLSCNGITKNILSGDTLILNNQNTNLLFDLVRPAGNGAVKYSYYRDGIISKPNILTGRELHLPYFSPGSYHYIYLIAGDDIWRSNPIRIMIYIIPKWWQTTAGIVFLIFIAIILALAALGVTAYITKKTVNQKNNQRNLKLELKNLQLALELKSIYAQINPHFIFNTLSTGLYFIKKKRMDEAYEHISSFSDLLRAYIKSSREKYITLAEEIQNLKNYIQLQMARFEDRFVYDIVIDATIDTDTQLVPSLLLQPLVENAIIHGLFHKETTGHLKIIFNNPAADKLICIVDDDGIGREHARAINDAATRKNTSYGTDLVKDLVTIFNTYEKVNIEIHYLDKKEPLTGTTVTVIINYLHEKL